MILILSLLVLLLTPFYANAQISGCTDPKSPVYNPSATINDGSCTYGNTSIVPNKIVNLPATVKESSGLLIYNGLLWTHNDSGGENLLYGLNQSTGAIEKTVRIQAAANLDWEDITRDDTYVYVGDFGNNNGNRTDLKVYKFPLADLEEDATTAETIQFSFADQTDFSSRPQNHNFDAEAIIAMGDSLYLFSKNWVNLRTKLYVFPKTPGVHVARLAGDIYADGLITGADFNATDSVIVLSGYTKVLTPFIWLLWDFRGAEVFSGNKRKINFNLPLHQVEGIVWQSGNEYLFTNEAFESLGNTPAALFTFNTSAWISAQSTSLLNISDASSFFRIYPNPTSSQLQINWDNQLLSIEKIRMLTIDGKVLTDMPVDKEQSFLSIPVSNYPAGEYIVLFTTSEGSFQHRFIHLP